MRYELNQNSEIVQYNGAVQFVNNKEQILRELFSQGVYECIDMNNDGCEWHISYRNTITNVVQEITVFYGNIRNEDRNEREKKIQLNGKDPRTTQSKSIILGLYCFDSNDSLENIILAGWNIDPNTNYPTNPSIRGLNIDILQRARFEGLYRNNYRNNIVCTFIPEFIFYYIENVEVIHNPNIETAPIENIEQVEFSNIENLPHQIIFYGSPGTGKSREVERITNGCNRTRTTFHPETDYHSFVGSYKPIMNGDLIKYDFVPQAFTKAYCNAWLNPEQPYFLIIEEINRGNCAQIFGDLFQCLDRDDNGFSKYEINCDKDLANYLKFVFESSANTEAVESYKAIIQTEDFDKIILPNNLYILATMNTSDQSLFPMDSAFKRRWDWEFVPINYDDANSLNIVIEDSTYNWGKFIKNINPKIKDLTGSEDKQLGNRFVNPKDRNITFDQFRSKVLFYLWSEVYKDELGNKDSIFKYSKEDSDAIDFQFGELYNDNATTIIKAFFKFNGLEPEQ